MTSWKTKLRAGCGIVRKRSDSRALSSVVDLEGREVPRDAVATAIPAVAIVGGAAVGVDVGTPTIGDSGIPPCVDGDSAPSLVGSLSPDFDGFARSVSPDSDDFFGLKP